jgi:alkylated DNA repair protein alkB family protein 8
LAQCNTEINTCSCYNLFGCDALKVPLRTGIFNAAISIAVLHHISTIERRLELLRELSRLVRVGGSIYIVAWAFEQDERSKRKFDSQDVMVEWKLQEKYASNDQEQTEHAHRNDDKKWIVYQRYCHVYRQGELEALISQIPGLSIISSTFSRSNWCIHVARY